jgi:hypothetical protein
MDYTTHPPSTAHLDLLFIIGYCSSPVTAHCSLTIEGFTTITSFITYARNILLWSVVK